MPATALIFGNLQSLNKGIEDKQKETRAFETTKLKYQQQKKTALDLSGSIAALEKEIAKNQDRSNSGESQAGGRTLADVLLLFRGAKKREVAD